MSFGPSNLAYSTFVYYCVSIAMSIASFLLTFVIFVIGSFYLKNREEKVQQRKEWRRFTEKIRRKHRQLKAKSILSRISNLKSTCESVTVFRDITGTDVLRFRSQLFQNREFEALCDGLDSVYMLLNKCASLLILDVPKNIKEEVGKVVADLGDLILPFYEEEERDIIEKCLKHFKDCGRPTQVEDRDERRSDEDIEDSDPEERAEGMRMVRMGDEGIRDEGRRDDGRERKTKDEIKQLVPYVGFLKPETHDGCWKFKLHLNTDSTHTGWNLDPNPLKDLKDLLKLLEDGNDFSRVNCSQFLKELKRHAGELTRDAHYETKDPDKEEVLHYVRKYLHKIVNERKDGCEENETENVKILRDVYVRLRDQCVGNRDLIKLSLERLIGSLNDINRGIRELPAPLNDEFFESFRKWSEEFYELPRALHVNEVPTPFLVNSMNNITEHPAFLNDEILEFDEFSRERTNELLWFRPQDDSPTT